MPLISIETSSSKGFIALFDGNKLIFKRLLDPKQKSSHLLMNNILDELSHHGYSLKDLKAIAVGLGPGSFLGTRIGVILAKTLAYGLDIKILGFCSLSAYCPENDGPFYVLSDAKSKGVYLLKGNRQANHITYESAPKLYSVEEFISLHSFETLITEDPNLLAKSTYFQEHVELTEVNFSLHSQDILKKFQDGKSPSNPLEKLDIHYLRLC